MQTAKKTLLETSFAIVDAFVVVIANADATAWKAKPVRKDAPTFILRVKGQESVETILLLTATPFTTVHLLTLEGTLLPVNIPVWKEEGNRFSPFTYIHCLSLTAQRGTR